MIHTIRSSEHKKSIVTCYIRVKTHKKQFMALFRYVKTACKIPEYLTQRFRFLSNKTKI